MNDLIGLGFHLTHRNDRTVRLGDPQTFEWHNQPDQMIRPLEIHTNAPVSDFITFEKFTVGFADQLLGRSGDGFTGSAGLRIIRGDTCAPYLRMNVRCLYTGLVPEGMKAGDEFKIAAWIIGVGFRRDQ